MFPWCQPELDIVITGDVGEFVRALDGPGVAEGNDQRGFVFGSDVGTLDMLVRFTETGHRKVTARVDAPFGTTLPFTTGTGPGNPLTFDNDIPVVVPGERMHVKQLDAADDQVGFIDAQSDAHQLLPCYDLIAEGEAVGFHARRLAAGERDGKGEEGECNGLCESHFQKVCFVDKLMKRPRVDRGNERYCRGTGLIFATSL